MFRALSVLMAALFTLGAVVQFNDPDPVRWMLVYGIAGALTAPVAIERRSPVWAVSAVALVALVWGLRLAAISYRVVVPGELFQAWEMRDERIEIAREAGGLLLIAAWMGILCGRSLLSHHLKHSHTRSPEAS